jgi:poly(beta-D-mannuronate) lyase
MGKFMMPIRLLVFAFGSIFILRENLFAATTRVASVSALQTAINNAAPGDTIILVDGVYTTHQDIVVKKKGTESDPIVIRSENVGGTEITGIGGFSLESPSAYIVIGGFRFTHSAASARMTSGTSYCRWTRNIFETPGKGDYLNISGSDHQIDYNTFQNKNSLGKFLAIRGFENQIAQRLWIHHNYFLNFANQGGANGAEALQFGLSGFSLSSSNSIVEQNLFEQCHGENELISVKASEVILRYNTIRDCPAQFTLRHGNRSMVYGNHFINTPGLRIFGDDHIVHSNYFVGCKPAINIGNGGAEVADGAPLVSHDRPDRVLIAFNTLVNNTQNIIQTPRKNGLGSTFITIAYNIIQGGGPAIAIEGPFVNGVWSGNIVDGTADAGIIPATGFKKIDPRMEKDSLDTFHLTPTSPAVDLFDKPYPSICCDMDGQPRVPPLDAGADEISDALVTSRVLAKSDVGHAAIPTGTNPNGEN